MPLRRGIERHTPWSSSSWPCRSASKGRVNQRGVSLPVGLSPQPRSASQRHARSSSTPEPRGGLPRPPHTGSIVNLSYYSLQTRKTAHNRRSRSSPGLGWTRAYRQYRQASSCKRRQVAAFLSPLTWPQLRFFPIPATFSSLTSSCSPDITFTSKKVRHSSSYTLPRKPEN